MSNKCWSCARQFEEYDEVVTFYYEQVKRGEKSGQLGLYRHGDHSNDYLEHVHFNISCLEKCFSPLDNPFMYDMLADQVRKDIEQEIRDEIYDEVDIRRDTPLYADDELPYCLWCKQTNTVWMRQLPGGIIFYCTNCQKSWDEDEAELTTAA